MSAGPYARDGEVHSDWHTRCVHPLLHRQQLDVHLLTVQNKVRKKLNIETIIILILYSNTGLISTAYISKL